MSLTPKSGKKDQTVNREVSRDILDETQPGRVETQYRNPNRDHARGDWDRSGRHTDEGRSRAEE